MPPKKKTTAKKKAATKKTTTKKNTTTKKATTKKKSVIKKTTAKKPAAKKAADKKVSKKKKMSLSLLRGMKDVTPDKGLHFLKILRAADSVASSYNFGYVGTPVVEYTNLFTRTIGKGTDVVDKEMYSFENRDGDKVSLRPEFTAGIARSYIMHGLHATPQPVKGWYFGPVYRYDRPQAGRYREFNQFGCETIGEKNPIVDAELISVAYNTLRDLDIKATVHINSIGTLAEREQYIIELVGYLRSKRSYLSELSKSRINKNPLRVLDSKEPEDQQVIEEAPQILDWLSDDSRGHFMKVLEYLDELEIPYVLTPTLVRGLDYYTDTVFEMYEEQDDTSKSQGALVGGGRYDALVEQLGGQPTPGAGFAMGVERVLNILEKRRKREVNEESQVITEREGLYFAQLGEKASRRAIYLIEQLRRQGITVHHNLAKTSLKNQMEKANKHGVSHAIILGQKEVQDETVLLRDMESGIQEVIDQGKLVKTLKKMFNL